MENIFLWIYSFFKTRRVLLWSSVIALFSIMLIRATTLTLEEDITKIFPSDERVAKIDYVFRNSRMSEKIVVMVSVRDSTFSPKPDDLVGLASSLIDSIRFQLASHLKSIQGQVDDGKVLDVFDLIQDHLPVFFADEDYLELDSLLSHQNAKAALEANYRMLINPSGFVTKNIIIRDPLGVSFLVMNKMRHLQYDENFELWDNFIVTRDHRHLLFFIQPAYAADDTRNNTVLLRELEEILTRGSSQYPELMTSFFGASVVAEGNARQLQRDTVLTVSLMVVLLMVALFGFFRKKRIPFLILLPVVFGGLFALACLSFVQNSLSILALAVGAVILGVAVDYSLHYLVLLKDFRNSERVIRELVKPLLLGSATTVLAFFCLRFTNASVLQDIGMFSGFSLIGAALCSLIILPHFAGGSLFERSPSRTLSFAFVRVPFETKKIFVYSILLLTPIFLYFAKDVTFNADMNRLNFMTSSVRDAEKRLEHINQSSLSSVYVVSSGDELEKALRKNEIAVRTLGELRSRGVVNRLSSTSSFLISDSLQSLRLQQWKSFWTTERKEKAMKAVREEGSRLKFSPALVANADSLISRTYTRMSGEEQSILRETFFDDLIIEKDGLATVITLAGIFPKERQELHDAIAGTSSYSFDRGMLTNLFVSYVNDDFTFIVSVTSVLVFIVLLISYGRIELTLITFVPMLVTWIWILGIMAIAGIEFNIVNVMVSTFIFGLGDDYSIFTMDGLLQQYRAGKKHLGSIRTSIFLSAITTVCGLGVLIFAQHPALRSIASISIIGIICVFVMSQVLEPFFFRILITDRTSKGLAPMTFRLILITVYTYGFFVFGSFFLTVLGLLIKLLPVTKRQRRNLFHKLICFFTRGLVYGALNLKKQIQGVGPHTFARSSVVISNHSSFMDILLTTMLHPKLILLTNKWVWNSPVFGGVVRLADYYPVMEGAEDSVDRLRHRIDEGYSVVVFPEGSRSVDGKIRRFHKGAFYIAEILGLPVQPVLIHGADMAIPKGTIYVNDATITMRFLPPIEPGDSTFGNTYSEQAKNIGRYFRQEHARLAHDQETPAYYHDRLLTNFIYKGPVLEWYARIKTRLENDYRSFHELIPSKGSILDLGCGYGFMDYMLQFLSKDRVITGVDYDEEKIETARHGYLRTPRLTFIHADVTRFQLQRYDTIVISDVLHYLTDAEQEDLVQRCFDAVNPGGKVIIRDGDRDLENRHRGTWLTELFSVRLTGFNKARNELNFISGKQLGRMAEDRGMRVTIQDETRFTSNVIFVISKPEEVHETV